MTRLIDADALITAVLRDAIDYAVVFGDSEKHRLLVQVIAHQPTIDAEPLRHGKWTADEILYTQGMTACSCCKTEYYRDDLYMVGNNAQGELPNYCPNCGARMDAE